MPRKIKSKVPIGKQVKELREELMLLRKQFQMVNLKIAEDNRIFDERSMCNWQYLWALVEALREDAEFGWLTETRLDQLHSIIVARWKGDALDMIKGKLTRGQGVCEQCHFVGGGPQFYDGASEESVCPNCSAKQSVFLMDTEVVSTSKDSEMPTIAEESAP